MWFVKDHSTIRPDSERRRLPPYSKRFLNECTISYCKWKENVSGMYVYFNDSLLYVCFPITSLAPHPPCVSWEGPSGICCHISERLHWGVVFINKESITAACGICWAPGGSRQTWGLRNNNVSFQTKSSRQLPQRQSPKTETHCLESGCDCHHNPISLMAWRASALGPPSWPCPCPQVSPAAQCLIQCSQDACSHQAIPLGKRLALFSGSSSLQALSIRYLQPPRKWNISQLPTTEGD